MGNLKQALESTNSWLTIAPISFPALKSGQLFDGLKTVFRTMALGLDPLDVICKGDQNANMGGYRCIHENS